MLGVVAEGKQMPNRAAVLGQAHRLDAGDLAQLGREIVGVFLPARGFLKKLIELLEQDHRLKLLHGVIAAADEVRPFAFKAAEGAPDVVKRLAPVQESIAIAGDSTAFAERNVFRVLETETTEISESAATAAFVFGQPGLAGV